MENDSGVCSRCGTETTEVKVLLPDERDEFKGLTIQQGSGPENSTGFREEPSGSYEYRREGAGHRVYVKQVSFGTHSMGLLTKLLIVAVILFLIFVALPVALIVVAISSLIWWLVKR
jgi:hypothetical protein